MHFAQKRRYVAGRLALALAVLALGACNSRPPSDAAYLTRGGPESLLDSSSEVVSLSVASKADVRALGNWIAKDQPSAAQLFCAKNNKSCADAQAVLGRKNIPVQQVESNSNNVVLVYQRIVARDCQSRFVDDHLNLYNPNHPSFGCSIAANTVQQVSDKRQFISPNLSDDPSARYGVNALKQTLRAKPNNQTQPYGVQQSVTNSAKTQ